MIESYEDILPIINNTEGIGGDSIGAGQSYSTRVDGNIWTLRNGTSATIINTRGFDKDINTYLRSAVTGTVNEYIELLFPNSILIGKYKLDLGNYNISYSNMASWDLSAKVNGVWVVVHSGTNTRAMASKEYTFEPVFADGIRITCTAKYGTNSWGFDDFYLYKPIYQSNDKSLILNDGKYKKYAESVVGITTGDLLPFAFTGNTTNGVTVSASNSSTANPPYFALDKNNETQWTVSTSGALSSPQYLTVDFGNPKKVTKVILNERNVRIGDFDIQYSDDGVTFTNAISTSITTDETRIDLEFPISVSTKHRYWRLNIKTTKAGNPQGLASIGFEGEIEKTIQSWSTVSTTLPSSELFQSDGMDSLSPLLDRKVTELPPFMMTDKTSSVLNQGDSGKVFSKTLNLNKYFDIRNLKVEVK